MKINKYIFITGVFALIMASIITTSNAAGNNGDNGNKGKKTKVTPGIEVFSQRASGLGGRKKGRLDYQSNGRGQQSDQ